MFRIASSRVPMPRPATRLAGVVPLLALLCAIPAGAQGRWIDIGAGLTERITAEHDPETWQEIPPFAFGAYSEGNFMWLEIRPVDCSVMPDPTVCNSGLFVAGVLGDLDAGNCPCTGVLLDEIEVQIHYDPARVRALGARESDLRMVVYEASGGQWTDMPQGFEVDPQNNVVRGRQGSHVSQTYAVLVGPQSDSTTWGSIKAHWQR